MEIKSIFLLSFGLYNLATRSKDGVTDGRLTTSDHLTYFPHLRACCGLLAAGNLGLFFVHSDISRGIVRRGCKFGPFAFALGRLSIRLCIDGSSCIIEWHVGVAFIAVGDRWFPLSLSDRQFFSTSNRVATRDH